VADTGNNRVEKFTSGGAFITKWGSLGSGNGQFRSPFDVAVSGSGDVYVTDGQNGRIQHFTSTGTYVSQFGQADGINTPRGIAINSNGIYVCDYGDNFIIVYDAGTESSVNAWGGLGGGNGFFSGPQGVNLDVQGNVYVAEVNNRRVQIFDPGGTFLTKFGTSGSSDGQFNVLRDASPDNSMDPEIYCADSNNQRIQVFGDPVTATGNTTWGRLKALYVK
jgi:sugar lactone lactonase YvrE